MKTILNVIRQRKRRLMGRVLRYDGLLRETTEGSESSTGRRRLQMLHDKIR